MAWMEWLHGEAQVEEDKQAPGIPLQGIYEGETLGMAMECCIVAEGQEKDAWKMLTKIIQSVCTTSMAGFVPEGTQTHFLDESLSKSMTPFLAVSLVEVLVYMYTK